MMHTSQIEDASRDDGTYSFDQYFRHLERFLDSSDLNIGNMEFTLGGEPYTGYPSFSAPDSFGQYLAECGFDVFLCANNHIFDKGRKGVERTLDRYRTLAKAYGTLFTGVAGNESEQMQTTPLIVNIRGIRVAFVNATYGTNSPRESRWPMTNILNDKEMLTEAMRRAEEKADLTIVLPHWGVEYSPTHSSAQREAAEWLVSQGADVIIGTHPHVVQDSEIIRTGEKSVPVIYSLGNCVSNMSAKDTQTGLMATVRITRDLNGDIRVLPAQFRYTWCSRPGGYSTSYSVLPTTDFMENGDGWKGRWEFEKMKTSYERVMSETGIKETIRHNE